jgi:hypothetical protein
MIQKSDSLTAIYQVLNFISKILLKRRLYKLNNAKKILMSMKPFLI